MGEGTVVRAERSTLTAVRALGPTVTAVRALGPTVAQRVQLVVVVIGWRGYIRLVLQWQWIVLAL